MKKNHNFPRNSKRLQQFCNTFLWELICNANDTSYFRCHCIPFFVYFLVRWLILLSVWETDAVLEFSCISTHMSNITRNLSDSCTAVRRIIYLYIIINLQIAHSFHSLWKNEWFYDRTCCRTPCTSIPLPHERIRAKHTRKKKTANNKTNWNALSLIAKVNIALGFT